MKKLQASNLRTINKVIDKVFSKVETNFTMTEILAYAKNAMSYKLAESQGCPVLIPLLPNFPGKEGN